MTQPIPRRLRPAFTVLELLVVMGIIALLAALAVPAMSKAYGVAAETRCVSNLRSLGQATAAYAADHRQKFPAGVGNVLQTYNAVGVQGSRSSGSNTPADERLLNRYIDDAHEVAVCPLDRGIDGIPAASAAEYFGASYVYVDNNNGDLGRRWIRAGVWSLEGFGLLDVTSPATKTALADQVLIRPVSTSEQNAWHGQKDGHLRSGMAFVDGHAEALRLKMDPTLGGGAMTPVTYGQVRALARTDPYH